MRSTDSPIEGFHSATARVDLSRLDENYRSVSASVGVPLMPVVKADAYGHGALVLGRRFEALGAPRLAVGYPEEGAALRAGGIRIPIVLLGGFGPGQEGMLLEHDLVPVVSTPRALEGLLVAARGAGRVLRAHLEVDTGMGRLGFAPGALPAAAERLHGSGVVDLEGVMTHLAVADEDAAATAVQLDAFDEALCRLRARGITPPLVHAANSAGLAHLRPTHTLARPGILLYGLKPRPLAPDIPVRPVMQVSARIALVKDVPPGTAISYGGRWVAPRASRIATIPLGYADGVPRTAAMAASGQFLVRGRRVAVAGTVCMDYTMADVTGGDVSDGDEAVLFGDDPTAWDVAAWSGTNAWDILTRVGPRLPRVYVEEGRIVETRRGSPAAP